MAEAPDAKRQIEVPYEEGFSLRTVLGAVFVGLVMMPGSIYMGLIAGQTLGPAAEWVTIILFTEVARRSFITLRRQEVYILYYVAGGLAAAVVAANLAGGPFTGFIWNQFLVRSSPAEGMGIAQGIPRWAVPAPDSPALANRLLFHRDWMIPILLVLVGQVLGRMNWFGMGYLLFRLTSDAERLPFPLAPITAEGATALAETTTKEGSWRWPVFSTGSMIGIVFGSIYVGIPALTGLILDKPLEILPIPFADLTANAHGVLPAALAGISFDLGIFLFAMVLPFPMVVGIFTSTLLTSVVANPILYKAGLLPGWQPGMNLLLTKFRTDMDFWMSIGIGTALAVAVLGIVRCIRSGAFRLRGALPRPEGRGDFPLWVALLIYAAATSCYVVLCHVLVPRFPLWMLIFFGFVWTPLNSYISARMIGLTGSPVAFPFLRETSFILARYQGVDIWFAPLPLADYGGVASLFRVLDLTRTKITSLLKAELVIIPVSLVCSFLFWSFFWYLEEIPSSTYPFTARMWPFFARNQCLFMTATSSGTQWLLQAIKPGLIVTGFGAGLALYAAVGALGLPALFFYGLIGGIAGWPNAAVPMFIGACIGRYVIARRLGAEKWRRYVPVLCAGYACGVGLIGMLAVGISIITRAVSGLPF
ncbi:MAG TPA: peptide transporter [Planctomycetota bacterium]|nr:peptide transporter [Planctomycetota bacterium]HRR79322.1 peptide transporter [Planctomycetota bacterium]HRT95348.1 peptide transporter [Planctomycetota bacterium]